MLGFALGCIRLSYDDFCGFSPEEFESICRAYHERREAEYKDAWERTRAVVVAALRPHVKGRPSTQKIYPLPWDKHRVQKSKIPELSARESKERFERLVERLNGADGF